MDIMNRVEALVVLDMDGHRLFGKYFPNVADPSKPPSWPTVESQANYERVLHTRLRDPRTNGSTTTGSSQASADGDIMLFEGHTLIFKVDPELTFIIIGSADENELLLSAVLSCIYEAFQLLTKCLGSVDKRLFLEHYDLFILCVDEVLDDGIILETTAGAVVQEVQPYVKPDNATAEGAKKALKSINKYLKQNL